MRPRTISVNPFYLQREKLAPGLVREPNILVKERRDRRSENERSDVHVCEDNFQFLKYQKTSCADKTLLYSNMWKFNHANSSYVVNLPQPTKLNIDTNVEGTPQSRTRRQL
jgi:hypothetical protein